MKNLIECAIEVLAMKIEYTLEPDDALKYTQAVLNLAHVIALQKATEPQK